MNTELSNCCRASTRLEDCFMERWRICTACGKPCTCSLPTEAAVSAGTPTSQAGAHTEDSGGGRVPSGSDTPRTDAELDRIENDEKTYEDRHDCYCALLEFARQLERELTAANERTLQVVRGEFRQICSYCGAFEAPPGAGWEDLQKHIRECPAHPLTAANACADALAEALVGCAARLSGAPYAPGPLENVKAIEHALAAYREATK